MPKHRQIVLDTETTGLSPDEGHRIIEIGCIELLDRDITGNDFHVYINPERKVDYGAQNVHGLSNEFLADKAKFAEIATNFFSYIADAELIIHNAPFDLAFIRHEFNLLGKKPQFELADLICIDTLQIARKMHPGQKNSLDALCRRYKVDNSKRDLHGALLDARLLTEVYLRMTGGQRMLFEEDEISTPLPQTTAKSRKLTPTKRKLKVLMANATELQAHQQYLQLLQQRSGKCVWETE